MSVEIKEALWDLSLCVIALVILYRAHYLIEKGRKLNQRHFFEVCFSILLALVVVDYPIYLRSNYVYIGPVFVFPVMVGLLLLFLRLIETYVWVMHKLQIVDKQVVFKNNKNSQRIEFMEISRVWIFLRIGFAIVLWLVANIVLYKIWFIKIDSLVDQVLTIIGTLLATAMLFPDLSQNIFDWYVVHRKQMEANSQEQKIGS